jgi:hypothetical protein
MLVGPLHDNEAKENRSLDRAAEIHPLGANTSAGINV